MAKLELPDGIKIVNPKPVDAYYDNDGVPYASVVAANAAIPVAIRYRGLTINVAGEEYWYKAGTADINLVLKAKSFDLHYVHTQGIASNTWTITHNLDKRPSIHFEDSSGNVMYPQVQHINNNQAVATFGNATYSGTAYCN